MSRCFPFPPPTYENKEALVELIKLQREKDEAKAERRREKKLKKQLKKENKDNEKKSLTDEKAKRLKDDKSYQLKNSKSDVNAGYPSKQVDDESEQLEKSDLTEEQEQPTCSGSICSFSVGTQSNNKRKRQDSSFNGSNSQSSIFRIRLPLRKHSESDADENCLATNSETRSTESTDVKRISNGEQSCRANAETNLDFEKREKKETTRASKTSYHVSGIHSSESVYATLIENWVPPLHQLEQTDFDHQEDWLFGSKQQNRQDTKRHKASNEVLCSGSSNLWPQANHLSEFDLYALPYTVPF